MLPHAPPTLPPSHLPSLPFPFPLALSHPLPPPYSQSLLFFLSSASPSPSPCHCAAINKGLAIAAPMPRLSQARRWSADWLFRVAGVGVSNHKLLVRMTMGDDNNGDDYDSTCVGSHAEAAHWHARCRPMLRQCRASAHAAAERRRHSYLRGLDHDAISSDRTTNSTVQMLQLVARAARFRVKDWSDTGASEVGFLCPDLDLLTIVYDQPAFKQAPSKRYRQLPPKRRKAVISMSKMNSTLSSHQKIKTMLIPLGHIKKQITNVFIARPDILP